jgi:hypothetical protein
MFMRILELFKANWLTHKKGPPLPAGLDAQ